MSARQTHAPARNCDARHPDPTEHRFGKRITLRLPLQLEYADGVRVGGVLRNVSISGALIDTAHDVPVFTNLLVKLPAAGGTATACELAACVVRRTPAGLALEWRDMACEPLLGLLRDSGQEPARLMARDPAFN